jgi:hypothetical protein
VLIENLTDEPERLELYGKGYSTQSYLYDRDGNQYGEAEVALGRTKSFRETVYPGIPLAASLTFRDCPTNLQSASLSLAVALDLRRSHAVLFRNAPVAR